MPPGEDIPNVVRLVEGVEGEVSMRMERILRFDYGWVIPWVRTIEGVLHAVGGPGISDAEVWWKKWSARCTYEGAFNPTRRWRAPARERENA